MVREREGIERPATTRVMVTTTRISIMVKPASEAHSSRQVTADFTFVLSAAQHFLSKNLTWDQQKLAFPITKALHNQVCKTSAFCDWTFVIKDTNPNAGFRFAK